MSLKEEFINLATQPAANIRQLCRRFSISPKTAYKWIKRFREEGAKGLQNRSRCPRVQPRKTPEYLEQQIQEVRLEHPVWGARKIQAVLKQRNLATPAISTITEVLRRHQLLDPVQSRKHQPWKRFQRVAPNELWQVDFKGHFALENGSRCHPLAVLDDHSRYNLGLKACANQQGVTVQIHFISIFRIFGLPWQMLFDNGSPWGSCDPRCRYTSLSVWLMRQGIQVLFGPTYHPENQGKVERFNRTFKAEVLSWDRWRDHDHCQIAFDQWRPIYNHRRPHEALEMKTPGQVYQPSPCSYTEVLPPIEYGPNDLVKTVKQKGEITFKNQMYYIGQAFAGLPIALRPTIEEGLLEVYFVYQLLGKIDLKQTHPSKWKYVSIQLDS